MIEVNEEEKIITEKEFLDKLNEEKEINICDLDTKLKRWLVSYTAKKFMPEDEKVTISMILDIFAEEFPELILQVAERNWVLGYSQAAQDFVNTQKNVEEHVAEVKNNSEE
jgi:hypothetical protein